MTLEDLLEDQKLCQVSAYVFSKSTLRAQLRALQDPGSRLIALQSEIAEAGRAVVLKIVLQGLDALVEGPANASHVPLVNILLWGLWSVEGRAMYPLLKDISMSPVPEFALIRGFVGSLVGR